MQNIVKTKIGILNVQRCNKSVYTSNIVNLIKEIDKKGFTITQKGAFYRVIDIDQIQFNKGDKGYRNWRTRDLNLFDDFRPFYQVIGNFLLKNVIFPK